MDFTELIHVQVVVPPVCWTEMGDIAKIDLFSGRVPPYVWTHLKCLNDAVHFFLTIILI